jgi:hypothetical protein
MVAVALAHVTSIGDAPDPRRDPPPRAGVPGARRMSPTGQLLDPQDPAEHHTRQGRVLLGPSAGIPPRRLPRGGEHARLVAHDQPQPVHPRGLATRGDRRGGDLSGPRRRVQPSGQPGGGAITGRALLALRADLPVGVDAQLAGGQPGRLHPGRPPRRQDLVERSAAGIERLARSGPPRLDTQMQQCRVGDGAGRPFSHGGDHPVVGGRGCSGLPHSASSGQLPGRSPHPARGQGPAGAAPHSRLTLRELLRCSPVRNHDVRPLARGEMSDG